MQVSAVRRGACHAARLAAQQQGVRKVLRQVHPDGGIDRGGMKAVLDFLELEPASHFDQYQYSSRDNGQLVASLTRVMCQRIGSQLGISRQHSLCS